MLVGKPIEGGEFFMNGVVKVRVRDIVKEELEEMRKQMRENPDDEPEPTGRFDRMTPDERYYIADMLGL